MTRSTDISAGEVHTSAAAGAPGQASQYLRAGLAAMSAGAAVIHFEVMFEHFAEYWLYGAFFLVSAWAQVIWALAVVWRPSRALLWAGVIGNAAIVLAYAVTRTVGDLIGPDAAEREPIGSIDIVATVFEIALVVGALVLLRRWSAVARQRIGPRTARVLLAGVIVAVVAVTVAVSIPALAGPEGPSGIMQMDEMSIGHAAPLGPP